VACAAWALGEAGITPLDVGTSWPAVAESGLPLVLHDALCPMVPASFLRACLDLAETRGAVVVGVRPVTDTIKTVSDGLVGATIDRNGLFSVASPVVLPPEVVEALDGLPTTDLVDLAAQLANRFPVLTLPAPAEGRRVASLDDVRLLEALTRR
jgi:2-C-methyl-D-erythritol 4-phosphate cytidylyltransferase